MNRETTQNYVTIQYFEWELPNDGLHWQRLAMDAENLKKLGVSGVWIPPCYKGIGVCDVGYGCYDLYDLGEFNQKGTVRTKYGTRAELEHAIEVLHSHDLKVYADVVLNHKAGADRTEKVRVVEVDPLDRTRVISEEFEIEAWTRFDFPGRNGRYSDFRWRSEHFTGADFDQRSGRSAIYRIVGDDKSYSSEVSTEYGNYDYLMYADVDFQHPDVIAECKRWGLWFVRSLKLDGLRLDAIKHIDEVFMADFICTLKNESGRELYVVGEYWNGAVESLNTYLSQSACKLALFDIPLHYSFHRASLSGSNFDLRGIFADSLVSMRPLNVMTFVDNHDTQPGQSMESWVEAWFKPLAYALILLRRDAYPCIFYGDLYGIGGNPPPEWQSESLKRLLEIRLHLAYGEEEDFFDAPNCIAFLRRGSPEFPYSGLVCLISNAGEAEKFIFCGKEFAGTEWVDATSQRPETIRLDASGNGLFKCEAGTVSCWVRKEAISSGIL